LSAGLFIPILHSCEVGPLTSTQEHGFEDPLKSICSRFCRSRRAQRIIPDIHIRRYSDSAFHVELRRPVQQISDVIFRCRGRLLLPGRASHACAPPRPGAVSTRSRTRPNPRRWRCSSSSRSEPSTRTAATATTPPPSPGAACPPRPASGSTPPRASPSPSSTPSYTWSPHPSLPHLRVPCLAAAAVARSDGQARIRARTCSRAVGAHD
jgi:hypothetical protein